MEYPEVIEVVIDKEIYKKSSKVFADNNNCPLATFFKENGFKGVRAAVRSVYVDDYYKVYNLDKQFGMGNYQLLWLFGIKFKTTARLVKF